MKFQFLLLPTACFLAAWGLTRMAGPWLHKSGDASHAAASGSPHLPARQKPHARRRQLEAEVAATMALPADPSRDDALSKRCKELLPSDPDAAYLLGTARWAWDLEAQREAGMKLAWSDPESASKVLARCPDLRSRDMLAGCVAATEVMRHPREKLRGAESSLEGRQRFQAVMAGVKALVDEDPDAVLAFALEPAPSELVMNIARLGLQHRIRNDPEAAIAWMDRHLPETRKDLMARPLFREFAAISPDQAKSLLPRTPPALQRAMVAAILLEAMGDTRNTGEKYRLGLEAIHEFPAELQSPAFRELIAEVAQEDAGQSVAQLLAITGKDPDSAHRQVVIESLMFSAFGSLRPDPQPDREALLKNLKTPEDKAAAARTLPYLSGIDEKARGGLMKKLKPCPIP